MVPSHHLYIAEEFFSSPQKVQDISNRAQGHDGISTINPDEIPILPTLEDVVRYPGQDDEGADLQSHLHPLDGVRDSA